MGKFIIELFFGNRDIHFKWYSFFVHFNELFCIEVLFAIMKAVFPIIYYYQVSAHFRYKKTNPAYDIIYERAQLVQPYGDSPHILYSFCKHT